MQRRVSVAVIGVWLGWWLLAGTAEASQFSNGLGKTWSYLTTPVNCLAQLGQQVLSAGTQFVICVLNNMNPRNLIP